MTRRDLSPATEGLIGRNTMIDEPTFYSGGEELKRAIDTLFAIRNQLEAAKSSLMFNNRWTNEAGYITDAALWIERAISAASDVLDPLSSEVIGG
jgi:hypothetical protein